MAIIREQNIKDLKLPLTSGKNKITVTSEAPSLKLAQSVPSIEAYVDNGDLDLVPAEGGSYYIVQSIGEFVGTNLQIPSSHPDNPNVPVKKIAANAFKGVTQLESVVIPSSIISIGENAFRFCSNLASVTFEESDTAELYIGTAAFAGNGKITELHIPNSVKEIGTGAFAACQAIRTLTFSNDCRVQKIGSEAFVGTEFLSNVTLPEGLLSLGSYAFKTSYGLINVTLPNSLTEIGTEAFSECPMLENVIWGNNPSVIKIGTGAFKNCEALESFIIPASVTQIGKNAFKGTNIVNGTIDYITFVDNYTWFYTDSSTQENFQLIKPSDIDPDNMYGRGSAAVYLCETYADKNWFKLKQMLRPTLEIIDNSTLKMTDPLGVAEYFYVYVGEDKDWKAQIRASGSGSGGTSSEGTGTSKPIDPTPSAPEESENLLGTWVFNDELSLEKVGDDFGFDVYFDGSDGEKDITHWTRMECDNSGLYYIYDPDTTDGSPLVYDPDGSDGPWDAYSYECQTITITSEPTYEPFIAWLKANAVKEGSSDYYPDETGSGSPDETGSGFYPDETGGTII